MFLIIYDTYSNSLFWQLQLGFIYFLRRPQFGGKASGEELKRIQNSPNYKKESISEFKFYSTAYG